MDAHVLVPLKAIDPKSRSGRGALARRARAPDARAARRVVGVVHEAGVDRVTVVTGIDLKGYEAWDDRGLPWNDALAGRDRRVVTAPLVAFISADLPLLHAEEVEELLAATPERGHRDRAAHDGGTNAVSMRPPGLVRTHFGEPQSAAVHAGARRRRTSSSTCPASPSTSTRPRISRDAAAACR